MLKQAHDLSFCYQPLFIRISVISDPHHSRRARSWCDCVSMKCTRGACRPSSPSLQRSWIICRRARTNPSWGLGSARTNAGSMVSCKSFVFYGMSRISFPPQRAISPIYRTCDYGHKFPSSPKFKLPVCDFLLLQNFHPHYAINFSFAPQKHSPDETTTTVRNEASWLLMSASCFSRYAGKPSSLEVIVTIETT